MLNNMNQLLMVTRRWVNRGRMNGYERIIDYMGAVNVLTWEMRVRRPYRLWSFLSRRANHEKYTADGAGLEAATVVKSVSNRPAGIHFLYGDYDMHYSPRMLSAIGVPCSATFHNPPAELRRRISDFNFIKPLSGIVLLGNKQKEFFDDIMPSIPSVVIPHGVDVQYFSPGDRSGAGVPICLLVGVHLRDWELISKFLSRLRLAIPNIIVHSVISKEYADRLPREEWIINHHPVTDGELRNLYRSATFHFYGATDCVGSNAIVESLACGLPTIAPEVGDIRDYVNDGAGLLFEKSDVESMVDAAVQLCYDADKAAAMRRCARDVSMKFSWDRIANMHLGFLKDIGVGKEG